jgi:hypothetical protein
MAKDGNPVWSDTGTADISINDLIHVEALDAGKNTLESDTMVQILDAADEMIQEVIFHTSGSKPINVGDQFGGLEIVGLNTTEGGTALLGAIVEYHYTVTNKGNVAVTGITVMDDVFGEVSGSPIGSLAPGESVTLTAEQFVTEDITNLVTATGSVDSSECAATDSAQVIILPPPPSECSVGHERKLHIDDDKIEWKIFNIGRDPITIESIFITFPDGPDKLGELWKIKKDGDTIWEGPPIPSPAHINLFIGDTKKLTIKAGDDPKLKFEFTQKAFTFQYEYEILVNFEEDCSAEFIPY